jgi:ankyrin repeat protein
MPAAVDGVPENVWDLAQRGDVAGLEAQLPCVSFRLYKGQVESALTIAARNDHAEAVAVLVAHLAALYPDQPAPLHFAALHGSCRAAAVLVQARASFDRTYSVAWAARKGHLDMLKLAAAAGAGLRNGARSAINEAAASGHVHVIQYLLDVNVPVDERNGRMETPLHSAAIHSHEEAVAVLLAAKAGVYMKKAGCTALALAAGEKGNVGVVARLLAAKAACDWNEWDTAWENTPLRRAVSNGDAKVVKRLLQAGARVDVRSRDGLVVLDVAAAREDRSVIAALLRAKAVSSSCRTRALLKRMGYCGGQESTSDESSSQEGSSEESSSEEGSSQEGSSEESSSEEGSSQEGQVAHDDVGGRV